MAADSTDGGKVEEVALCFTNMEPRVIQDAGLVLNVIISSNGSQLLTVSREVEAIDCLQRTKDLLAESNLRLHKIASNSAKVMEAFPRAIQGKALVRDLSSEQYDWDVPQPPEKEALSESQENAEQKEGTLEKYHDGKTPKKRMQERKELWRSLIIVKVGWRDMENLDLEWRDSEALDLGLGDLECPLLCDGRQACLLFPLLLLLQASLLFSFGERTCPNSCRCEGKIVHCESAGFVDVPENISVGCQGLSLRYNDLHTLLPYQFAHLNQLLWIYLDHNQISVLDSRAFQGVRRLKELILSSNKISLLHNATFHGIPNLRSLDLSYNKLEVLQPGQFHGLRKLQNLHLRSNGLTNIPIRAFLECRSLEFLDLGYNRIKALTRTTFLGLQKLMELHLEHNQFSRINFFLFPRLANLRSLYLQWNRIRVVNQGLPWTWYTLQKLDLSGNEIQTLDPAVFHCLPNLQILNLESNKLSNVSQEAVTAWISLTSISLAGNMWDCGTGICPLVAWLRNFRGSKDTTMICSSPKYLQGEKIMDATRNHGICEENDYFQTETPSPSQELISETTTDATFAPTSASPVLPPTTAFGHVPPSRLKPIPHPILPTQMSKDPRDSVSHIQPTINSLLITPPPEMEHMTLHKVVVGSVALFFTMSLIITIIYVLWRRYPDAARVLQQQSMVRRKHRKKSPEPEQNLSSQLQEYYMSYNPAATPEGLEVLGNGTGACTCAISGSRECENEYTCRRPLPGAWLGDVPTIH
ncbi:leucine-rich repeat transmembrane neuronal protein 4-like [Lampris incognitus]|uniref:leucine-rich repeat transmembrane neuronal protein 4-like n=1 Tax=Lampris incognitus TaxID=2546036 RepID=UPI0024B539C4|nr:leucine-rich repeat transmembrane neuronal protein 4-like [Lampris incognitus]